MKILSLALLLLSTSLFAGSYPREWWQPVNRDGAPRWEVLPQDAKAGEVILSKRNELGIFSNLSNTPFTLDGEYYESVEGLWQMMKYPDPNLRSDPRSELSGWSYSRDEVKLLSMWDSKTAGNEANKINRANGINWINYGNKKFNYNDRASGSHFHYKLIRRALRQKLIQNPKIKKLLMKTKGLKLRPDHNMSEDSPKSYKYHLIFMELREEFSK